MQEEVCFMQGIDWSVVVEYKENFIRGFFTTIELTVVGILFGTLIGLILGLMNISRIKVLMIPAKAYVDLFRGTPLMLQILAIHFGIIPTVCEMVGVDTPSALISGFIALSLNAGAYISEIFRGGIQSIDKGQMEAARSLGMSYGQAMRRVILPQAYRRMIPPMVNEFVTLLKDSSLVSIISMEELMLYSRQLANATARGMWFFGYAAFYYLVMTTLFTTLGAWLERKLKDYE